MQSRDQGRIALEIGKGPVDGLLEVMNSANFHLIVFRAVTQRARGHRGVAQREEDWTIVPHKLDNRSLMKSGGGI